MAALLKHKKRIFFFAFICMLFVVSTLKAQIPSHIDVLSNLPADSRFEDVKTSLEKHFNRFNNEQERNKNGYKQWKRWEWFADKHLDPDGRVSNWTEKQQLAITSLESLPNLNDANGNWSTVGPGSISNGEDFLGRTEQVAFHPTNPNILYIATGTGGLWRTTNLGLSWTPLTDNLPSLSIASVVVQQNNPNILYILTGDGDGGINWGYYVKERSSCVFRSTDAGATWQATGLNWNREDADRYGCKLIQSMSNPNLLIATTSNGTCRTTNGGTDWTQELTGQFTDVVFRTGNPHQVAAIAYGSCLLRTSADSGDSWINHNIPSSSVGTTRSMLAVSADAANNVYVLMGNKGNGTIRGY